MRENVWMVMAVALIGAACSSSGGPGDGGLGDAKDGGGGDLNVGEAFPLVVPPGTVLCSVFYENRTALDEYRLRGQLSIREGQHRLGLELAGFELDLLEGFIFGPERRVATLDGPMSCAYSHEIGDYGEIFAFDCRAAGSVAGKPLTFRYQTAFTIYNGQLDRDRIVFDEQELGYPVIEGWLNDGSAVEDRMQFASCRYDRYPTYRLIFDWQNGDRTILDEKIGFRPILGYVGETSPANVIRAEVTLSGQTREETDHFKVVYASGHHNWYEKYLVTLDPPMGDVHGIYCEDSGDFGMGAPAEQLYLGAGLDLQAPLRRIPLQGYQVQQIPPP